MYVWVYVILGMCLSVCLIVGYVFMGGSENGCKVGLSCGGVC